MKQKRQKYEAAFKAKVAIEAIKENETLSELSAKYGVSQFLICRWKSEFLENASAAFSAPKSNEEAMQKERDKYLRKIGDLEMQLDFAKRVSRKLGIEIPAGV